MNPVTVTMPALARLNGVEIVHIGEHIPASTGPVTITKAHLDAMVKAAADPRAPIAVLKIGHKDPRFDGEPGYGTLRNFRLSADGSGLLVDIVGVPAKIAYLAASCWPSRSIEFIDGQHLAGHGLTGYAAVCLGVALLGATLPAITRLEDLYTNVGIEDIMPNHIAALAGGLTLDEIAQALRQQLSKAQSFLHDLVVHAGRLAAIFEDANGQLYQALVDVTSGNVVSLGEPEAVYRTYQPVTELSASHAISLGATTMPTEPNDLNKDIDDLLAEFNTPAALEANTATPEDVMDPDDLDQTNPADPDAEKADDEKPDDTEVRSKLSELIEDVKAAREIADSLRAELHAVIQERDKSDAKAKALEEEVAKLSEFQASVLKEQRAALFSAAIKDGRITPSQREGLERWADVDPEGFTRHLSSLQPTRPQIELGYAGSPHSENPTAGASNPLAGTPWDTTTKE